VRLREAGGRPWWKDTLDWRGGGEADVMRIEKTAAAAEAAILVGARR